jgi:DNA-binding winged helix-turn-helix (wHTH) protein
MGGAAESFGPFVLDRGRSLLLREGKPVAIGQRGLALLDALLSSGGNVDKRALMEAGWPGTAVEEGNLTVQIAALRKALGEREDGGEWIVTVPRVGYRLVRAEAPVVSKERSLPVLSIAAFESIGADAESSAFADGLVEELITALSRFKAFTLLGRRVGDGTGGAAADYVVEGSVRRSGAQVRVVARLQATGTGANVWSHTFDGGLDDAYALQEKIASVSAAQVSRTIYNTEQLRAPREGREGESAYDLLQRGIGLLEAQSEPANRQAITVLEQAVALGPTTPQMLAMTAWAYEQRIHAGWISTPDDEARCLELTRAAIASGSNDANLLGHCGIALQLCGDEWEHGLQTTLRGVTINPSSTTALFFAGVANLKGGTLEDARRHFERALVYATDVEAGNPIGGLAHVLLCEGKFEEALATAERALAMRPRFFWIHWVVIAANAKLGRIEEAHKALASYRAIDPDATLGRIERAQRTREPRRHANLMEGLKRAGMPET